MTMYGFRSAVLLIALPLVAAGCTRQPEQEAQLDNQMPAVEQRSDTSVTTAVQAKLYADDMLRGEDIDVSTNNGVVTLRGSVESEAAEQQALSAARTADGVSRVEDQLDVRPMARAQNRPAEGPVPTAGSAYEDDHPGWITTKIQAQYFVNPGLKPWNIDVTTSSGGIVELRGEVDDAQDKAEAVRIARNTDGVARVEDHLRIQGQADMPAPNAANRDNIDADFDNDVSDPWLTAKIQSKYFLNTDVKGRDIDVDSRNGVVTLRGTVESAQEQRQAVAIARNTDGVVNVRDELQVQTGTQANASTRESNARGTSGNLVAGIEDTWITTKVQSQYFLDGDVKGHEINVDTRNGVVTLSGSVENNESKQLAEQIARETDGVTRVVNRLTVEASAAAQR